MQGRILFALGLTFITSGFSVQVVGTKGGKNENWPVYRGDKLGRHYSPLAQINRQNVHGLQVAWEYRHGKPEGPGLHSNPIIVDGLLYYCTPRMQTVAVNAGTGRKVWEFDPAPFDSRPLTQGRSRGVHFWQDDQGRNRRIFSFVKDRVYALDAATGKIIKDFGKGGWIDLRNNLSTPPEDVSFEAITPGATYKNFLMVCGRVQEGADSTPGDIRAYDTVTGEFRWIFHTVPQPGEPGYETWKWEEGVRYGGANPWGGYTIDDQRGWVFFATGAGAPDLLYGGQRKGENLYSNCVVALDGATGERKWHFQTIRHDIWDYDNPPAPLLATIRVDGVMRDVVVQMGKTGLTFVLDRDTGVSVFPVEDRPVPASLVRGEEAWPTQPFPVRPAPLVRLDVKESDLTDISPEAHAHALAQFRQYRSGPIFTPITVEGSIVTPGLRGGIEWGGGAFDPASGIVYVNANERPVVARLVPLEAGSVGNIYARGKQIYGSCTACHGLDRRGIPPLFPSLLGLSKSREELEKILRDGKGLMPSFAHLSNEARGAVLDYALSPPETPHSVNAPSLVVGNGAPLYSQMWSFFLDAEGYPAIKPPWGTLNAIDLNRAEILWTVPLGEYPELVKRGIRNTGTENFGAPVVTAGGVVFIAATADEKMRAFDTRTGEVLWEYKLPAGGYATPAVYMLDGRQYVVIAAGGGGKQATPLGNSIVAFALPEPSAK